MFILNSARPRAVTVLIGTLDAPSRVDVDAHVWLKRKLPWVTLPDTHSCFDEAGDFGRYYAHEPERIES